MIKTFWSEPRIQHPFLELFLLCFRERKTLPAIFNGTLMWLSYPKTSTLYCSVSLIVIMGGKIARHSLWCAVLSFSDCTRSISFSFQQCMVFILPVSSTFSFRCLPPSHGFVLFKNKCRNMKQPHSKETEK